MEFTLGGEGIETLIDLIAVLSHSSIHSFNKYLVSVCYVPVTLLGTVGTHHSGTYKLVEDT